jgi:hypothetical protein
VPFGSGIGGLVAPVGDSWPDDKGMQCPTISTDTFYGGYQCSLYDGTSVAS